MKDLNEKLAEVCGMNKRGWLWYKIGESEPSYQQVSDVLLGDKPVWNPTTDLNQLRECYLAAEESWDTEEQMESFGSRFATVLGVLLAKDAVYESTFAFDVAQIIAWVKHPEHVAQAILKAKGVV